MTSKPRGLSGQTKGIAVLVLLVAAVAVATTGQKPAPTTRVTVTPAPVVSAPISSPPSVGAESAAPVATLPPIDLGFSGIITFGTTYNPDTLEIPKPLTRFKATFPEIAWSAELTRPVGATSITLVLASQSASGVEKTLITQEVNVGNPEFTLMANAVDLALLLDNKPGTYVMRYIESGEILAEGTFTLVK